MKIYRFIDAQCKTHFGLIPSAGAKAEILGGDLFAGLQKTGKQTTVKKILPPLVPVNIFAIGLNYKDHAKETGAAIPDNPIVFMKPTSCVCGHGDPIVIPKVCSQIPEVDYEAELGIIIGKAAKDVSPKDALDYVFGYTCAHDVSARRWQKNGGGGQWIRGKSFDTFCPLGPAIVTKDEIEDPQSLEISLLLNAEQMQSGNTSDMIFTIAELVSFLSKDTTLLPGTLIITGTPSGVGFARKPPVFLKPGDEVIVKISGVGELTNSVF